MEVDRKTSKQSSSTKTQPKQRSRRAELAGSLALRDQERLIAAARGTHLLARLLLAGAGQNALSGEPSITVGNIKEYQADNSIKSRFLPLRSVATIHGQAVLWADGAQDSGAMG